MSFSYEPVPMVLQEFGALQTSLLKHTRRLKQRDSLPLDAAELGELEDRQSPSVLQGQSSGREFGGRSPQKVAETEAFCTFAHTILQFCPMCTFRFSTSTSDTHYVEPIIYFDYSKTQ